MECSLINKKQMSKLLSFCFLIFCFACNDNKAEKAVIQPTPPKYYFFPKANVYFDTVNKDYVFVGTDGKTWVSGKQIPAVMQSMMDKRIVIDSPSMPVWEDNENHKLVYSALLYVSPNDTVQKKAPVVLKPVNTDSIKKEKKGLGKFLDKLFGRKKKDKAEEDKKNQ